MWVYLIVAVLLLVGILGGIFAGGIFTIVLVPIALIILLGSIFFAAGGSAAKARRGEGILDKPTTDLPLPHEPDRPSGRAPSTPEALADARRAEQ